MSFPRIFRRIFANNGAGPKVLPEILPISDRVDSAASDEVASSRAAKAAYDRGSAGIEAAGEAKNAATAAHGAASAAQAAADLAQSNLGAHAALTSANTHGAVAAPTANRIPIRDANGRFQVAAPAVTADAANKGYVDEIVESWRSGGSWYRKWRDGFIEQGGMFTSTAVAHYQINLHTPMPNGNYFASASFNFLLNQSAWSSRVCPYNRATSNMTLYMDINQTVTWYVCGY